MENMFHQHYLKQSFFELAREYNIAIQFKEPGHKEGVYKDGLISLFLEFRAPGNKFGVETDESIDHYWELINRVDESDLNLMSLNPETGKMSPAGDHYFVFRWWGEIQTNTTLTIDVETFLDFLRMTLENNPSIRSEFLHELANSRIINEFIRRE